MNILICGDSFSADYGDKDPKKLGWTNLLSKKHDVTNLSRAGASQYRIWRQVKSQNLSRFDQIIINHTSPYRIYVDRHPLHSHGLHSECDLIYQDIKGRGVEWIEKWFEECFDITHAIDIHQLLIKDIASMTFELKTLHLGHLDISAPRELDFVDFSKVLKENSGNINHYSAKGNEIVYNKIIDILGNK